MNDVINHGLLPTPEPMTPWTARTDDEHAAVMAEIARLAQALRRELDLEDVLLSHMHGDDLYDENGLPA